MEKDKPKKTTGLIYVVKNLFKYIKQYRSTLIITLLFTLAGILLDLYTPTKIKDITNYLSDGINNPLDLANFAKTVIFLIFIYLLAQTLSLSASFIVTKISQNITKKIRLDLFKKTYKIPLSYYDNNNEGDVLSRITNDVDTLSQGFSRTTIGLISASIYILGSIIMMFYYSFTLAIVSVISSTLSMMLIGLIMAKSQKFFRVQANNLGKMNAYIEETISLQMTIKNYNSLKKYHQNFLKLNDELYTSTWKSRFFSGLVMPIVSFSSNFSYVVVAILGAYLVINQYFSFGVVAAFIIYIRIYSDNLGSIMREATFFQSSVAASDRIFNFLDLADFPDVEDNPQINLPLKGKVEFRNVDFAYQEQKIIDNFNLEVQEGQKIAIVGHTGSGKTTLINLLLHFYELNSGSILIDDININQISRKQLAGIFTMVLQETWLFRDTIMNNIRFNTDVSEETIIHLCKDIGIDHIIRSLPYGYQSILDEKFSLSSGERQLLTIARAMLQDSSILILDEATSSVDVRTEVMIQQAMEKLMKGKTSFIIAHRLSTIKNADKIIVLDKGVIVESGTHTELLAKKGHYYNLHRSQF